MPHRCEAIATLSESAAWARDAQELRRVAGQDLVILTSDGIADPGIDRGRPLAALLPWPIVEWMCGHDFANALLAEAGVT